MFSLLALAGIATWTVADWAIAIIVIFGIVAVVVIFLKQTGTTIPPFIISVLWVLLAVVVCVAAVKFIASM